MSGVGVGVGVGVVGDWCCIVRDILSLVSRYRLSIV